MTTPLHCKGTPLCIPTQRTRETPKPCDQWSQEALASLPLLPRVSLTLLLVHSPYRHQLKAIPAAGNLFTAYCSKLSQENALGSLMAKETHWSQRTSWQRTGKRKKKNEKTIPEAGAELCKPAGPHTTKQASKALSCKANPESWASLAHGFCSTQKIPAKALNLLCIQCAAQQVWVRWLWGIRKRSSPPTTPRSTLQRK